VALEVPPSQRPSDLPADYSYSSPAPTDWWQQVTGFVGQIGQRFGIDVPGLGGGGGMMRAPDPSSVVPRWVLRIAEGAAIGGAIYEAYIHFRGTGANHKSAKRMALLANGIRPRRRRMRATNLRALRRAVRRLRGFRRAAGKVHGVLGTRGRSYAAPSRRRRRVYRRGDVSPFLVEDVEDYQDDIDDLEDEGLDPSSFPEEIYE